MIITNDLLGKYIQTGDICLDGVKIFYQVVEINSRSVYVRPFNPENKKLKRMARWAFTKVIDQYGVWQHVKCKHFIPYDGTEETKKKNSFIERAKVNPEGLGALCYNLTVENKKLRKDKEKLEKIIEILKG